MTFVCHYCGRSTACPPMRHLDDAALYFPSVCVGCATGLDVNGNEVQPADILHALPLTPDIEQALGSTLL